jgi:glycosyltransferase involved in cell wall biosynthesis
MTKPAIIYTCRVNLRGPISTIHREVSRRLSEYQFTAFGNYPVRGIDKTIIVPESMTAKDIPQLIRTYGGNYDIIHTGPRKRDHLARLTTLRGAKHVHTLHAAPNEPKAVKRERALATHADHVTTVSEFVKRWAINTLDIGEPITVIPNGIDLDLYKPIEHPSERTFVFVGRLVEQKYPEQVLRLAQEQPDATFKICGSGPLENRIASAAQSLPNVELIPELTHEELAELYADATATLCPYKREGFGMVAIESMACGTPVIGLDSGNFPSLINEGHNGLLCDSLDLDEWVAALEHIQTERENFEPRECVKRYSWDVISKQYQELYNNIEM